MPLAMGISKRHVTAAVAVFVTLVCISTAAEAQLTSNDPKAHEPTPHGIDLGLAGNVSTLGVGGQISLLLGDHIAIRSGYNGFRYNGMVHVQGIDYDAHARWKSVPMLLDLYPGRRGSFHFTGGALYNRNEGEAVGVPGANQTIDINGTPYTPEQLGGPLHAHLTYPEFTGYAGLGFGTPARGSRIAVTFDIGAVIATPTFALSAPNAATNAQLASDIQTEQAQVQHHANEYLRVYPVLSLGVMLRF